MLHGCASNGKICRCTPAWAKKGEGAAGLKPCLQCKGQATYFLGLNLLSFFVFDLKGLASHNGSECWRMLRACSAGHLWVPEVQDCRLQVPRRRGPTSEPMVAIPALFDILEGFPSRVTPDEAQ